MEEILHHLGRIKNPVNIGINHQPQLVGRISEPSTVLGNMSQLGSSPQVGVKLQPNHLDLDINRSNSRVELLVEQRFLVVLQGGPRIRCKRGY